MGETGCSNDELEETVAKPNKNVPVSPLKEPKKESIPKQTTLVFGNQSSS